MVRRFALTAKVAFTLAGLACKSEDHLFDIANALASCSIKFDITRHLNPPSLRLRIILSFIPNNLPLTLVHTIFSFRQRLSLVILQKVWPDFDGFSEFESPLVESHLDLFGP